MSYHNYCSQIIALSREMNTTTGNFSSGRYYMSYHNYCSQIIALSREMNTTTEDFSSGRYYMSYHNYCSQIIALSRDINTTTGNFSPGCTTIFMRAQGSKLAVARFPGLPSILLWLPQILQGA